MPGGPNPRNVSIFILPALARAFLMTPDEQVKWLSMPALICLVSSVWARSGHIHLFAGTVDEALGQRSCLITSLALLQVWALSL